MKDGMEMLGKLGGYIKSKSTPHPGFEVLLKGMIRLYDIVLGVELGVQYFMKG